MAVCAAVFMAGAVVESLTVRADAPPLISREVLFGNPDKAQARISPDGTKLSYLAPVNGVLNVWVGPVNNPSLAKPVTNDTGRGIRMHFWAFTNNHILYLQDKGGDENWRVYSVDLESGKNNDLTPFEKVQARIQQVSHKQPYEILVGLNNRNPMFHDIHRVNISTGETTLVVQNDEFLGFVTDDDFNVRIAQKQTEDGGSEVFKADGQGGWASFFKIPMEDLQTEPVGFDKSGTLLYMHDSRDRNTAAFATVDMSSGERKIIAENERADVSGTLLHPTEHTIQAVAFTYDRQRWEPLDPAVKADFEQLAKVAEGEFSVASATLDDRHWIVAYVQDDGPVRYYLFDREPKKATFLFTNRESLEKVSLAKMKPVVIKTRDGLDMICYITLPLDADGNGDGKPDQPLPMVLMCHGGPWARTDWGYNPYHQWFANRGYAVVDVNFRGSTGFGKEFLNASTMEWAGKMHDDLIDAVDWAVKEGVADAGKVAIWGGSYGGYAALVSLTFTPTKFACAVDIVGPSNLVTLLNSIPPYWKPMIELFTKRVGDHRTEEGRKFLTERSPLTHVDKIQRPLLIGQGANDPRVNQAESDQIVKAMQDKDIPVTYVLFSDEGHGFARPENRLSFNAVTEAFLAKHLGGRYEPVGEDFKGSSIAVPAGADQVPGLRSALENK
jgi:dipeptidyl aminopeptidase/acylaminoacyl peptidase